VQNDPDRALIDRYRAGDVAAFGELVARYQRPIYNAAYWIVHRPEDANDIAQTVFLRAAERIDDYDPQHRFFSWIYRIAVNESLNLLRRNGHEAPLELDDDVPDPADDGPESNARSAEASRRVRGALMKLSASDRAVVVMRHFSECSYREIAQALDIEEKTVKSRLFEARRRLRDLLPELHGSQS
jgi:RNA polymerase sigma-70 factor (ECF subfamily)